MKHILCTLLSGIPFLLCHAQPIGAPGTSWTHCLTTEMEPGAITLIHVTAEESISFQGHDCVVLRSDDFWKFAGTTLDSVVICNIGDQVYYAEGDSLHLVYDFSLQAGEAFTMRFPLELNPDFLNWFPNESLYWDIHVDSVKTVEIDGISLRRQYINYFDENRENYIWLGDHITERIGYQTWILPFLSIGWGEFNPHCQLQEFSDADIHVLDSMSHCLTSGIATIDALPDVRVWPNPCTDVLYVEADDQILDIRIMSLDGTVLANNLKHHIHVAGIPSGIYFIAIVFAEGVVVRKIMKEG